MLNANGGEGWPRVAYESAAWLVSAESGLSRRQQTVNRETYDAAVVPRIAETRFSLASDLAADLDEATAALVRLDARADALLETDSGLAPLPSVLLRTESSSSSEIEGLTASARKLALAELGEASGPNAMQIAGNVRAVEAALRLAEEPGVESVLAMHATLLRDEPRHTPGELRTVQVWIGGGAGPRIASFVPPRAERVRGDLEDLAAFVARDDIPSLAHASLAHAQFETIHPFTDGNGRTGRALVHAMLRRAGTTRRVATPISAGLLTDPEGYFVALGAYRDGDIRPILETFARSARQAGIFGGELVDELAAVRAGMRERTTARADSSAWRVIDLAIAHPVLNVRLVAARLRVSVPAATNALQSLETAGVLRRTSAGRRNRVWQSDDVLAALDGFAERIRRSVPARTGG